MVFLFAFIKILLYTNYGGFMKKVIYLNSNNVNLLYRKFRLYKFLSHFNINFIINYCGKEYTLNDEYPQELGIILNMTDILNTRNKKEKYNKIYDRACNYLDNEFRTKNICDFKNDICISRRNFKSNPKNYPLIYGCCFTKGRVCPNLINYSCSIKCLSCKLFTCRYLTKKHIKYRINDILLLKLFFNLRQKEVISNQLFTDEDEFIKILMKKKSLI